MSDKFSRLLAARGYLFADGATGTNLFNMGLGPGDPPEFWNETHPERIRALYDGALNAGCDLFLTNSFGANSARLKLHDSGGRAFELARLSAQIGHQAADAQAREIIIAGSIGPTGEIMEPSGTLTHDRAVEIFTDQIAGLKAGGVDILWLETISDPNELRAAAQACAASGLAWAATMSFDTSGRTMMGLTSRDFATLVQGLPHPPIAFGANCGVGAADLLRTVLGFGACKIPIIAKANAGIPKYENGEIYYDGTPELMANYATLARNAGAKIIGGCCGTTPAHLKSMHQALEKNASHSGDQKPSLDQISAQLGAFSSATDGLDLSAVPPPRTRRRARRRTPS